MFQVNSYPQTRSVAFTFLAQTIEEIGKQIDGAVDSKHFSEEQFDFVVLICDQFQKLVRLRHRNQFINEFLTRNFPEFFKTSTETVATVEKPPPNVLRFMCDVCDEEVPILNNDPDYSTQVHLSSPYHLEVISVLRTIKESRSEDASSSKNLAIKPAGPNGFQKSLDSGMKTNAPSGKTFVNSSISQLPKESHPVPKSGPNSKVEELFERFAWIKNKKQSKYLLWRHSMYYCCLCNANLPTPHNFDAHVEGITHKMNVAMEKKAAANSVGTSSKENFSSGDSQSNGIIVKADGMRYCNLCEVRLPSEANFVSHINGSNHRTRLEALQKTDTPSKHSNGPMNSVVRLPPTAGNAVSNAVTHKTPNISTPDFIVYRNGMRYCDLCDVKIPGKPQFDSHVNGSLHQLNVNIAAPASVKKPAKAISSDSFIVYKGGIRHCKLCDVQLPGESQLIGHKNGFTHKNNLKEYEQKHPRKGSV